MIKLDYIDLFVPILLAIMTSIGGYIYGYSTAYDDAVITAIQWNCGEAQ